MKRIFPLTVALLCIAGVIFFLIRRPTSNPAIANSANVSTNAATNLKTPEPVNTNLGAPSNTNVNPTVNVVVPIADYFNRVTKKPFGIYITPQNSPVHPEKFAGYHTGADAETTPSETSVDVPIFSIADGTVVFADHVNGYGGMMVIQSSVGGETITALYGHLRISAFTKKRGETVTRGEQMAVLGTGYSTETDGERKHLHLGIIKGTNINYQGYVDTQPQLSAWEDPVTWLKSHGA